MIKSPISEAMNTSTYVALTLGDEGAYGFTVTAVDTGTGELVGFYYATDAAGTDEAPCANVGKSWPHYEAGGQTVIYVKAMSGTPTAVLDPGTWVKQ